MEDVQVSTAVAAVPADATGYAEGIHQWRRYFARMLDNMVNAFTFILLVIFLLAFTWPSAFVAFTEWLGSIHRLFDLLLSIFIGTVINAVLLALTGSTLGKWIFGIRVREADGARLGFARAIQRELRVWMRGLGFGIPIVSLFTVMRAYNQLDNFQQTTWDRDMQLVITHRPAGIGQYVLWTFAVLGWVAFTVFSLIPAGAMP